MTLFDRTSFISFDIQAGRTTSGFLALPFAITGDEYRVLREDTGEDVSATLDVLGSENRNGIVTLAQAPSETTRYRLVRATPLTQETDYSAERAFPIEAHEFNMDRLFKAAQETRDIVRLALGLGVKFDNEFAPMRDFIGEMTFTRSNGAVQLIRPSSKFKIDVDNLVDINALKGDTGERGPQGRFRVFLFQSVAHGAAKPAKPTASYNGSIFFGVGLWGNHFPSQNDPLLFDVYESFATWDPANNTLSEWSEVFKVDGEVDPLSLTQVARDATLIGDGTTTDPLGIAANAIDNTRLQDGAVIKKKLSAVIQAAIDKIDQPFTSAEKAKLAGVEANAAARQTATEIIAVLDTHFGSSAWRSGAGLSVGSSLFGDGTTANPLGIANDSIDSPKIQDEAVIKSKLSTALQAAIDSIEEQFTGAEKAKLADIEDNATADQTALEIIELLDNHFGSEDWRTGGIVSIADGSIITDMLADKAVTGSKIADLTIEKAHLTQSLLNELTGLGTIPDNSITSSMLSNDVILERHLDDQLLIELKASQVFVNSPITGDGSTQHPLSITVGGIQNIFLDNGSVSTDKVQDFAITPPKIADNAITPAKIPDGSISSSKLDASLLAAIQTGGGSGGSGTILDGSIITAMLADGAVVSTKLGSRSVTLDKMALGTAGKLLGYNAQGEPAEINAPIPETGSTIADKLDTFLGGMDWRTGGGGGTVSPETGTTITSKLDQHLGSTEWRTGLTGADIRLRLDTILGGTAWRTNIIGANAITRAMLQDNIVDHHKLADNAVLKANLSAALQTQIDKLAGIEAGAEVNPTGAEIITAIDGVIGSGWQTGGGAAVDEGTLITPADLGSTYIGYVKPSTNAATQTGASGGTAKSPGILEGFVIHKTNNSYAVRLSKTVANLSATPTKILVGETEINLANVQDQGTGALLVTAINQTTRLTAGTEVKVDVLDADGNSILERPVEVPEESGFSILQEKHLKETVSQLTFDYEAQGESIYDLFYEGADLITGSNPFVANSATVTKVTDPINSDEWIKVVTSYNNGTSTRFNLLPIPDAVGSKMLINFDIAPIGLFSDSDRTIAIRMGGTYVKSMSSEIQAASDFDTTQNIVNIKALIERISTTAISFKWWINNEEQTEIASLTADGVPHLYLKVLEVFYFRNLRVIAAAPTDNIDFSGLPTLPQQPQVLTGITPSDLWNLPSPPKQFSEEEEKKIDAVMGELTLRYVTTNPIPKFTPEVQNLGRILFAVPDGWGSQNFNNLMPHGSGTDLANLDSVMYYTDNNRRIVVTFKGDHLAEVAGGKIILNGVEHDIGASRSRGSGEYTQVDSNPNISNPPVAGQVNTIDVVDSNGQSLLGRVSSTDLESITPSDLWSFPESEGGGEGLDFATIPRGVVGTTFDFLLDQTAPGTVSHFTLNSGKPAPHITGWLRDTSGNRPAGLSNQGSITATLDASKGIVGVIQVDVTGFAYVLGLSTSPDLGSLKVGDTLYPLTEEGKADLGIPSSTYRVWKTDKALSAFSTTQPVGPISILEAEYDGSFAILTAGTVTPGNHFGWSKVAGTDTTNYPKAGELSPNPPESLVSIFSNNISNNDTIDIWVIQGTKTLGSIEFNNKSFNLTSSQTATGSTSWAGDSPRTIYRTPTLSTEDRAAWPNADGEEVSFVIKHSDGSVYFSGVSKEGPPITGEGIAELGTRKLAFSTFLDLIEENIDLRNDSVTDIKLSQDLRERIERVDPLFRDDFIVTWEDNTYYTEAIIPSLHKGSSLDSKYIQELSNDNVTLREDIALKVLANAKKLLIGATDEHPMINVRRFTGGVLGFDSKGEKLINGVKFIRLLFGGIEASQIPNGTHKVSFLDENNEKIELYEILEGKVYTELPSNDFNRAFRNGVYEIHPADGHVNAPETPAEGLLIVDGGVQEGFTPGTVHDLDPHYALRENQEPLNNFHTAFIQSREVESFAGDTEIFGTNKQSNAEILINGEAIPFVIKYEREITDTVTPDGTTQIDLFFTDEDAVNIPNTVAMYFGGHTFNLTKQAAQLTGYSINGKAVTRFWRIANRPEDIVNNADNRIGLKIWADGGNFTFGKHDNVAGIKQLYFGIDGLRAKRFSPSTEMVSSQWEITHQKRPKNEVHILSGPELPAHANEVGTPFLLTETDGNKKPGRYEYYAKVDETGYDWFFAGPSGSKPGYLADSGPHFPPNPVNGQVFLLLAEEIDQNDGAIFEAKEFGPNNVQRGIDLLGVSVSGVQGSLDQSSSNVKLIESSTNGVDHYDENRRIHRIWNGLQKQVVEVRLGDVHSPLGQDIYKVRNAGDEVYPVAGQPGSRSYNVWVLQDSNRNDVTHEIFHPGHRYQIQIVYVDGTHEWGQFHFQPGSYRYNAVQQKWVPNT